MLMYKLKQNKDKSPTFASCYFPAWTVCSDTPSAAWATCDGPWALQGQGVDAGPSHGKWPASSVPGERSLPGLTLQQALSSASWSRGTSPVLATWPPGAASSPPCALPRKKHH